MGKREDKRAQKGSEYLSKMQDLWHDKQYDYSSYGYINNKVLVTVICKKHGDVSFAHHLDSYTYFPDKRYDLSNGVNLCGDCHDEYHLDFCEGVPTKEDFELFKEYKRVGVVHGK